MAIQFLPYFITLSCYIGFKFISLLDDLTVVDATFSFSHLGVLSTFPTFFTPWVELIMANGIDFPTYDIAWGYPLLQVLMSPPMCDSETILCE